MGERDRQSVFKFLVDVNPVAKLYKKLLGVSDLIALSFADDEGKRAVQPTVSPKIQVSEEFSEEIKEAIPPKQEFRSASQRYGDADHARRYGDYDAAHEIEKEKRRHFKID